MREYFTKRSRSIREACDAVNKSDLSRDHFIGGSVHDDWDGSWNVDGRDFLARTVVEEYEVIDTGVVDENGDKIMARRKMEPIGFVKLKDHG